MKKEKMKEIVDSMLSNLQDIAKVTELLNTLQEENNNLENALQTIEEEKQKILVDNEQLRQVNMKFFLKLSGGPDENKGTQTTQNSESEPDEEKMLSFDDLFNEKGELI